MDATTQLFVRACKTSKPITRLSSVYRHRYYAGPMHEDTKWRVVSDVLGGIIRRYLPDTDAQDMLAALAPDYAHRAGINEHDSYWLKVVKVQAQFIRYAAIPQFPGMRTPARFRR